jgi:hypothetical protein
MPLSQALDIHVLPPLLHPLPPPHPEVLATRPQLPSNAVAVATTTLRVLNVTTARSCTPHEVPPVDRHGQWSMQQPLQAGHDALEHCPAGALSAHILWQPHALVHMCCCHPAVDSHQPPRTAPLGPAPRTTYRRLRERWTQRGHAWLLPKPHCHLQHQLATMQGPHNPSSTNPTHIQQHIHSQTRGSQVPCQPCHALPSATHTHHTNDCHTLCQLQPPTCAAC